MTDDIDQVICDHCPTGRLVIGDAGKVLALNKSAEKILGQTIDSISADMLGVLNAAGSDRVISLKRDDSSETTVHITSITGQANDAHKKVIFLESREDYDRMMKLVAKHETLSLLGSMVADIIHEINNPLAAISGQTQILMSEIKDHSILEQLKTIDQYVQRASATIQNLMQVSKQRETVKVPCDLNNVVESALKVLYYRLRMNDIKVDFESAIHLPMVLADTLQIQQVIVNLVNNAQQAILNVRTFGKIKISTGYEGKEVFITVADDGSGIKSDDIGRIFEPFFTTDISGKGTGIGLSVAFGIIKDHRGKLTVESFEGGGSTFKISMPVTDITLEQKVDEVEGSYEGIELQDKEILVIDDEKPILDIVKKILEHSGCRVTCITNAIEGIQMLTDKKFDAIVSDIKMPGLDGKALYDVLKSHFVDYVNKIGFISGDTISVDTSEFLRVSGRPYLIKPFQMADIVTLTKKLIRDSTQSNS